MDALQYTSIPDTTDGNYWQLKRENARERLKTFVPIDKDLHRSLMIKARQEAREEQAKERRISRGQFSKVSTNRGTWVK